MIVAKDKNNNTFHISKDDPRFLSGELVGIMKGIKTKHKNKRKIIKCPYCSKEGDTSNMKRWHFDKCKYK